MQRYLIALLLAWLIKLCYNYVHIPFLSIEMYLHCLSVDFMWIYGGVIM